MAGTTQVSRALRIVADAGLGHGELTEVPVTGIGSGELLLRASHSSVNYKDALAATGQGKVVRRFPLIGAVDVGGAFARGPDPVGVDGPGYRGSDRGAGHPPSPVQWPAPRPGPGGRDRGDRRRRRPGDRHARSPG